MFIGEYLHNLDSKRRLAVPAKFRKDLGKRAIITRGLDSCLFVYPLTEWEKVAKRLSELPTGQKDTRDFVRLFLAGAADVELDNLGRILIPDFLSEYAILKGEASIIGVFRRIEIWNKERWQTYRKEIERSTDKLAEKLGEIGAY
ncbi:cell division/cell wall cluster transcriptional repressor MraZ [Candidatus Giovannonibacteria bacterium RIFCSPLOWO2_02_FULL_45_14]|uniref:Transcriptional regulator MraZ n=1 Tax=Candidatus Giovannonibacteria bacterium RIFCSPLOWO2_12_FULL_44_15 TaxID=1798364 RepID=A0A1F5XZE2_9BACT|nr:MAG: cell division/cell wall cluster transcriptional repressor MraZ [Candidatus Giovannonibacteria bacterium RIFCSPHIGHO2_02_FULL_44_31]OGF77089.1 MAG: cell division/cell wall cluster transcriptional repressor MraZ [Candidatus Giovannonibacteria bacterium RIFCSPHIGHO2_12_FULL_44_29]OGF90842.1 MAG: cell division/cell wall cluster transcriptional repressor MraZ [Candidatus Giovannonibacteria bacterium RIFCSPLOWO2_02_FULL_45_14]OGF93268.1 MAG: cell division/cell wall cluster transcriptional repr